MKISEKISYLRKKHHLTQQELCQQLNVSRQTLSKWENGATLPSEENLSKLSQFFNVSLETLKDDEQDLQERVTPKKHKKVWIIGLIIITVLSILFCVQKDSEPVEVYVQQFDGIGELKSVEIDHQDDEFVYLKLNYRLKRKPITIITVLKTESDDILYEESITTDQTNGCIIPLPKQYLKEEYILMLHFNWWEENKHILGMILPSEKGYRTILDTLEDER